ncbi:MAG: phosphoribosylglycinamide formyltransferase [Rickettsiales bacterium]
MKKHRVAVLISGNGSNLQALIDAAGKTDYPANIVLVISNKEDAFGLTRAKNAGIASYVVNHKDYNSREEFDMAVNALLLQNQIEFVCLAGFMRILSARFVNVWKGKMLNIHPSLLPDFKGAHAVRDALNSGVKESGCSVHLVTEEMDAGEIIAQAKVSILSDDTQETLHQRIHRQEHILYPYALELLINRH